jgi:hypothetical protein
MKKRAVLKAGFVAFGMLSGCVSRTPSYFTFPETFTAQQVVSVQIQGTDAKAGRLETFVAVLRRSPLATRVVLLDPVFLVPFVTVDKDVEGTRALWLVPEPDGLRGNELPSKLMVLLDNLYGEAKWENVDEALKREIHFAPFSAETDSFFYRATLSGAASSGEPDCAFPKFITVFPKRGEASEIRVETSSVDCGASRESL